MATGGHLDPLTIAAVFLVVFAAFYGGAELREGELLPPDTTTATEDRLRTAVWNELNERRAARGVEPMPRNRFVRGVAQDTTEAVVARRSTDGSGPSGSDLEAAGLPNQRLFCTRVVATAPVGNATRSTETAVAVADALQAADESGVPFRSSGRFRAGMGVAVHDGTVYAIYRSCERVDT